MFGLGSQGGSETNTDGQCSRCLVYSWEF